MVIASTAKDTSFAPCSEAVTGILAQLHVPENIFENDDRVINQA